MEYVRGYVKNMGYPQWGYPKMGISLRLSVLLKMGISLNGDIPILFALWDILIFEYRISPCLANMGCPHWATFQMYEQSRVVLPAKIRVLNFV